MLPHDAYGKLSSIFGELHSIENYLEDYSVSQSTVEQVFLKLAREQVVVKQSDEVVV